ncbi:aminopeptidase P N-terminal domain-containing protein, partial [Betaproteobacteria bacterium]|nr:aminopeptidase P N-terminal domain-containing protein [Betaproteobacteria bacterium]
MRKKNMRKEGKSHLTGENKRLPDINLTNYEKFKKRRVILQKNLQRITAGKPFTALLYSGDEVNRNGDVSYPFRCNSNFYYLTGFKEPNAWMIIFSDGRRLNEDIIISRKKDKTKELWNGVIIGQRKAKTDYLFDKAYATEAVDQIVTSKLAESQCVFFPIAEQIFSQRVTRWLSLLTGKKRMGIDNPVNLGDLNCVIENQRVIKDAYELKVMKKAACISAAAHREAMKISRPGLKELDVETALLQVFRNNEAYEVAYPSIVAGGPNACVLHHRAGSRILKKNELLLIDAGCEFNGYASDITRTFPVSGKFTKAQKLIYEIVLLAQRDAIQKIKVGEKYNAPHEEAVRSITQNLINAGLIKNRNVDEAIEKQDYREFYMHRTGHWLGLDVHDVGSYNTTFKKNMVLTVEPGIYIRPSKNIPR